MGRIARFLAVLGMGLASQAVVASDLELSIRRIDGPAWRAEGIEAKLVPPNILRLRIARIVLPSQPPINDVVVDCRELKAGSGAHCDNAGFRANVPGLGKLDGKLKFDYRNALRWQAALTLPAQGLTLALTQEAAQISAALTAQNFTFSEASGRYATDKLSADAKVRWHAGKSRLEVEVESRSGQAYVEPVFADFALLPLKLDAALVKNPQGWAIERLNTVHGKAGGIEASGQLDAHYKPVQLQAKVQAQDLAPMIATAVQPFLIGSRFEGLAATGRANAQIEMREGTLQKIDAQLLGANIKAEKIGMSVEQIAGELHWAPLQAMASSLKWSAGALKRVPLGASAVEFRAQGKDFELLKAWRQPLLEGALNVERLVLRGLGGTQLSADFQGALEPINLTALCRALGWPEFSGTLGGRLPGLSVRDEVWTIDGALEAQLFDGSLRLANLQAIQPFGVLPRVMADIEIRRWDLERVTSAFSFGRITGRLDGEIKGLRLLNWTPVAFDARVYSSPDDDSKRRISQRAIDAISSIGGGPTGILSRGFLSVFEDFAYDRLGVSCVLRDNVCLMDGVEQAPSKEGLKAYYLVKGRLLPRIDVVGYAQRVSWSNLIAQLQAARTSGGPKLEK